MNHTPITLKKVCLYFPQKSCFENFSTSIPYGSRIGIIGANGMGKSTLLKMLQGIVACPAGAIAIPDNVTFGYVPQVVTDFEHTSGGQRFNQALTKALALNPNVLCLDEPTNHLDSNNYASLMKLLQNYTGTLIFVSHDSKLLRACATTIWHIEDGTVKLFNGSYDAYKKEHGTALNQRIQHLEALQRKEKRIIEAAQAEQERAAHSKRGHKNENDSLLRSKMQETAAKTHGKKNKALGKLQDDIQDALQGIRSPEILVPKFNLDPAYSSPDKTVVEIVNGSCGYNDAVLMHSIHLRIGAQEHVALTGANGSGKSTLIKTIAGLPACAHSGEWHMPPSSAIGYLDQHYSTLDNDASVYETVEQVVPRNWKVNDIRTHLNNFLFSKNEEVMAEVSTLSGGERARLSLAVIAVQNPRLLLLDEITNNLDKQARDQVIQILKAYPGALMIISHDEDFLNRIGIDQTYLVANGTVTSVH